MKELKASQALKGSSSVTPTGSSIHLIPFLLCLLFLFIKHNSYHERVFAETGRTIGKRQLSSMDLGIVMGFAAWLMNHDLYRVRENVPI